MKVGAETAGLLDNPSYTRGASEVKSNFCEIAGRLRNLQVPQSARHLEGLIQNLAEGFEQLGSDYEIAIQLWILESARAVMEDVTAGMERVVSLLNKFVEELRGVCS